MAICMAPSRSDPAAPPGSLAADAAAWDDLRAFLAVSVHGSMNRAARALGESQPTVGRRLKRLEQALGVALLERGVNAVRPTAAGLAVLKAIAPMAAAAREAADAARVFRRAPVAPVRVTATTSLSLFLSGHLPELRAASAPRDILLMPSRRLFDLPAGEADIALRMRVAPQDSRLLVRKLGVVVFAIYARRGAEDAPLLMPPDLGPASRQFALARRALAHRPAGPEIDEIHLRIQAVASGFGAGSLPCFVGDADPDLVRLHHGPDYEVRDDLFLVRTPQTRDDPAIEATAKALARLFRRHRALLAGEAAGPRPSAA